MDELDDRYLIHFALIPPNLRARSNRLLQPQP